MNIYPHTKAASPKRPLMFEIDIIEPEFALNRRQFTYTWSDSTNTYTHTSPTFDPCRPHEVTNAFLSFGRQIQQAIIDIYKNENPRP